MTTRRRTRRVLQPGNPGMFSSPPALPLIILCATFLLARTSTRGFQYSTGDPRTVVVAPDTQYRAGALHRLLFGAHWRDLWATPIEVEVLDLDDFAGGLRPVKRGGGKQTKSLRLRGADGREYKFRSITKDPRAVLPPELRESIAAGIVQDQISSSNPMAALVVPDLLDAAGVLNARPQLVLMPRTSKLGEFQEEFGGLLGTIEENPDDPDEALDGNAPAAFAGAEKFRGTIKLLDELEEDDDEVVDDRAFLKARLVDIFVGDWDRHIDQWRWAGYREGKLRRWVPIPRDRDQAFARFDGLFPWIASVAVPQLEGFGDHLPEIEDLTWSGRFLDRRLLTGLEWPAWDSIASDLRARLTDSAIERAARRLPEPMFALEGENLIRTLTIRRDALPRAAREFYELLAEYPDIRLSDKREYVEARWLPGERIEVTVRGREKSGGGPEGPVRFRRTFLCGETHEIRLYLHGGDDLVRITGERSGSTGIVIAGGKGDDEVIDESTGGGFADTPPFTLFSTPPVRVFDEDRDTKLSSSGRIAFDDSPARKPSTALEKYEPAVRDYGYDWKFAPWYSISPDEGLFLGGGPILYKHGFRAEPWVYRMQLRGGFASGPGRFRADFTGDFRALLRGPRVTLLAEISQLDILNFFGAGNGTTISDSLRSAGYYRARSRHVLVAPSLVLPLSPWGGFTIGAGLKGFDPDPEPGTILAGAAPDSWYGSLRLEARVDTRDHPPAATRGVVAAARFAAHHPLTSGFRSFQNAAGELRAYLTPGGGPLTAALRAGGSKNWGDQPWYEAVFLGGAGGGAAGGSSGGPASGYFPGSGVVSASAAPLRGYERQRFAGDAALYAGTELRLAVASFQFLVPGRFGVSGAAETGRVFLRGESSNRWHGAAGGGIWFSFVTPFNVLSVSVIGSPEDTGVYVAGGFAF